MEAPKHYHGTKYVRAGCSTFSPDFPDDWYNLDELPVPKDTARKKCNQTYRAHKQTRKVLFVPSIKVKVKASGSASRNTEAKGKAARRAAAASSQFANYSTDKLFARCDVEGKSEE